MKTKTKKAAFKSDDHIKSFNTTYTRVNLLRLLACFFLYNYYNLGPWAEARGQKEKKNTSPSKLYLAVHKRRFYHYKKHILLRHTVTPVFKIFVHKLKKKIL